MIIREEEYYTHCQQFKRNTQKYGKLPPKDISYLNPWDEVHVDMIGPWKVVINNFEYTFRAVTCINVVINLPGIIPVENAKSQTVAATFEDGWLSRYPIPARYVHDNGNEFLGLGFNQMLIKNNIQPVPTTVKNPPSNAIVERLHQTLNIIISISPRQNPPTLFEEVSSMAHRKCASAQFAIRATSHSQHKFSPGQMAFGRHMLLPFSTQVNWDDDILRCKQSLVDTTNIKENNGRRFHDYKIND